MVGLNSKYQHMLKGINVLSDLTVRRGTHEVGKGGLVFSDRDINASPTS